MARLCNLRGLVALLVLLAALAAACEAEPPPSPAPVASPTEPTWTATERSPLYTIQTGDSPRWLGPDNALIMPLEVGWEGIYGEEEGAAGCDGEGLCQATDRLALSGWTLTPAATGYTLEGRAETDRAVVTATWRFEKDDPEVHLGLAITWKVDTWPDREAFSLRVAGTASVLGADLRFGRAGEQPSAAGIWAPHRLVAGSKENAIHLSAKGFLDIAAQEAEDGARLTLTLDDAHRHPFRARGGCKERDTLAWDRWTRRAGERAEAEVVIWVGHSWAPIVHRLPRGYDAALAVLDTATSTPDELSALLQGHSQRDDPRYGNGGVHGHQLAITKALFAGPSGLGKTEVGHIARRSSELGGAFANLGPTDSEDEDSLVEAGLEPMRRVGGRIWLDADEGACDGLLDGGWRTDVGRAITDAGYDIVFAGTTTPPDADHLDALRSPAPFLWRHDRLGSPRWMFQTTDLTAPFGWKKLDADALESLAAARGVAVVQVELGTVNRGGGLRQEDSGAIIPTGELEKRLFDLADAQERGVVWTTSVPSLVDQLEATRRIELHPLPDGRYRLLHRGPSPTLPITLLLPGTSYRARLDGADLPFRLDEHDDAQRAVLTWLEVGRDKPVDVEIVDASGRRVQPLVPVRWKVEGVETAKR